MEKPESAAAAAADHLYDKSFIQPSMEKFEPDFIEDNKKVKLPSHFPFLTIEGTHRSLE